MLASVSGCGGGGSGGATPTPSPSPTPTPTPVPTPSPTSTPLAQQWQLEGDSYVCGIDINGVIYRLSDYIALGLGEPVITSAASGSTIVRARDRIVANTTLRANPLLIWDGFCNQHVDGSLTRELDAMADIVAFKAPFNNWLYLPSVTPPPGAGQPAGVTEQFRRDMLSLRDQTAAIYGHRHVYDPVPLLQSLSSGNAEDQSNVAAGFLPRSIMADGLHLKEFAVQAVAQALTAPGGPMAVGRAL